MKVEEASYQHFYNIIQPWEESEEECWDKWQEYINDFNNCYITFNTLNGICS